MGISKLKGEYAFSYQGLKGTDITGTHPSLVEVHSSKINVLTI